MRSRGNVARTQMKKKSSGSSFTANQTYDGIMVRNGSGAFQPPRNSVTATPLSANMPKYSAMKKRAYLKPLYSVRWPAISSLSASGKSKGARFASANDAVKKSRKPAKPHGVNTNHWGTKPQAQESCAATIAVNRSERASMTTGTTANSSGSS